MKKTIRILTDKMEKLQDKTNGNLQGGFASVKGGFSFTSSVNENCSNTKNCNISTNICPGNIHVCVI